MPEVGGDIDGEQPIGLSNQEFSNLETEEQNRLIEYNESVQGVEQAHGRRLLFERAPPETLPFIVYCLYVSGQALVAVVILYQYQGEKLPFFLLIGIAMIAPIFALPTGSFSRTISWVRKALSFS